MAYTKRNTVRYLCVGAVATAVYLGSWWLGTKLGLSLTAASIIAFPITWILKFLLHKFWVFEDADASTAVIQTVPYACMTFGAFLVYGAGAYGLQYFGMREIVADAIAGIFSAVLRFTLFHWLFAVKNPVP